MSDQKVPVGEEYRHTTYKELTLLVPPNIAKSLGFALNHMAQVVGPNQSIIQKWVPLTLEFYTTSNGATLLSRHYRECRQCGEDHEALVIAFCEWYRKTTDSQLVNMREYQEQKWIQAGVGEQVAHRISQSGLSDDEILRRLGLIDAVAQKKAEPRLANRPAPADADELDAILAEESAVPNMA